jgi:feruloyl esterase
LKHPNKWRLSERLAVAIVLSNLGAAALAASPGALPAADPCGALSRLTIANVTVAAVSEVPSGTLSPLHANEGGVPIDLPVPEFCRVEATAAPTPDSQIGIEVWMPKAGSWNGKLLGVGNGGYSSILDYKAMADGVSRGYVTVGTDGGHRGDDLRFIIGHPEKIVDWTDRAIHVMTDDAKAILRAYYQRLPERSYFAGCSTGGFQAFSEAQRHPDDYDGIIAGAPGYARQNLSASFMAAWSLNHDPDGHEILTRAKLAPLNAAVVAACDGLDGGKDGFISDPRQCRFDPISLLCKGPETDSCLTQAQVDVVRAIYRGPENPRTRQSVFPGWDPGSEALGGDPRLGWTAYIVGQPEPVRLDLWKFWIFGDPEFDFRSFDYDKDLAYADRMVPTLNAVSSDLREFARHGGKLLMYAGWADNVSSARTVIDYYRSLRGAVGDDTKTQAFARLFLMPGVGHCGGGPGPDRFDAIGILDNWVEHGTAPDRIVAAHLTNGITDLTRPLCSFPQVARWSGSGSRNDERNFRCEPDPTPGAANGDGWLERVQQLDAQSSRR